MVDDSKHHIFNVECSAEMSFNYLIARLHQMQFYRCCLASAMLFAAESLIVITFFCNFLSMELAKLLTSVTNLASYNCAPLSLTAKRLR